MAPIVVLLRLPYHPTGEKAFVSELAVWGRVGKGTEEVDLRQDSPLPLGRLTKYDVGSIPARRLSGLLGSRFPQRLFQQENSPKFAEVYICLFVGRGIQREGGSS